MTTDPPNGAAAENLVLRGRSFLIVGAVVLGIGWLARPILGPFIVAAVIAYACSPVVTTVQHRSGLPRVAVVTIFAVLVGLSTYGVLGGLLGVPIAAAVNVVFRELAEPEFGPP